MLRNGVHRPRALSYTRSIVRLTLTRVFSVIVIVWALVSVIAACRSAVTRAQDPIETLDREFRSLSHALPPAGPVGFLRYDRDDDHPDRVLTYYAAQYALAPRVVEKRTDLEFLIVAPGAARPEGDERLRGFVPVTTSREGYAVYQRRQP